MTTVFNGKKKTALSLYKIVPFFVGLMVALGLFYVVQNTNIFQANILSLQEKELFVAQGWDVGYKVENGFLDVYLSEIVDDVQELEFALLFDEDSIAIDVDKLKCQCEFDVILEEGGRYVLGLSNFEDMDIDESLIMIPYTGDGFEPILGSVVAFDGDRIDRLLRVGNLNENRTVHRD